MGSLSEERVLAVLNGEIPDRVPIFEYLIHDGVFGYFGAETIPIGDVERHIAACSKCLDLCHPLFGTPYEPSEKIHEDGSKTLVERWMSWNISAPNPIPRPEEEIKANLKNQINELENSLGQKHPSKQELIEKNFAIKNASGGMLYIDLGISMALPYGNRESEILTYADFPELVEEKMRLENILTLERLQATAYKELSSVAIIWDDIAYKNGLFYPPELLERLFFPPLTEICDLLHSRGIRVVFHSDGDISSVLPSLVHSGIDGLNPLEISAGMNYPDFKRKFGQNIALVGGMDAVSILALGSVDQVVAETKRLIDTAGARGGLIAASSSGQIDMGMPTENAVAYIETVWEYGKY